MKKSTWICLPSVICMAVMPLYGEGYGKNKPKNNTTKTVEITPPAPAIATHWADPFITAEYIYWKAEETGLQYASSGLAPDALTNVNGHGTVHKPSFHFDSGFKAGLGLKFQHDGWDLYANYTWLFSNENQGSVERKEGQALQGFYLLAEDSITHKLNSEKANSNWSLHFNTLDLELGRNFFISKRLTLRPHFGLKFSWHDQDMEIQYNHTRPFEAQEIGDVEHHFDQDQFGIGIRTGLNTAWYLWNKWSVFGNFAATALYSDFDVHRKTSLQLPSTGKTTQMHFGFHPHAITPVLEFALGLRFETNFSNNNYQFMLQAGWEEQIWFDQNQLTNFVDFSSSGNLTLQGLTVKAGFAF